MNNFNIALKAFLMEAKPLLEPIQPFVRQKQYFFESGAANGSFSDSVNIEDVTFSVRIGLSKVYESLQQLESYSILKVAFDNDPVLNLLPKKVGSNGEFDQLVWHIFLRTFDRDHDGYRINIERALAIVDDVRGYIGAEKFSFDVNRRVLSLTPDQRSVEIADGFTLVKLSRDEINERQPYLDEVVWLRHISHNFEHPAEFRVHLVKPLPKNSEQLFTQMQHEATLIAEEHFKHGLEALYLVKSGRIALGSGFIRGVGSTIYDEYPLSWSLLITPYEQMMGGMELSGSDAELVKRAYRIVSQVKDKDKMLHQALHRFFLARSRIDYSDQLVDYVIAWESILQTVNGNANKSELRYRFSLNGSSLINATDPTCSRRDAFDKMQKAYDIRSNIVHGGINENDAEIWQLIEFLENSFRKVVFWLDALEPAKRPYKEQGGWENLLWLGSTTP